MIFAGVPPTTTLSGTSFETTEPAATTEFSPMVTPCKMVALAPIHAFFLMWMGFGTSECLLSGRKRVSFGQQADFGRYQYAIFNSNSSQVQKSTIEVDEIRFYQFLYACHN